MDTENITFQLRTINILEYSFKNPVLGDSKTNWPIEIKYAINYKWDLEKELIGVVVDFLYQLNHNETIIDILKLSIITEFHIDKLSDHFVVRSPSDLDMNTQLETTLTGLALSTGRGILFEKTQGTLVAGLIFPPVPINDLLLSKRLKESQSLLHE